MTSNPRGRLRGFDIVLSGTYKALHMIACSDDPQRTAIDRSESSQGVSCRRWIAPVRGGRNLIRNSKRRVLRASWTERRRKIHLDELHNRFLSGNGWTDPAHGL